MIENIDTERLRLQKMEKADAKSLLTIWSDPDVTKYMNITQFTQEEQALEMIELLEQLAKQHKAIRFSIFEKASNHIIGSCGFNMLDYDNALTEIGYDLGKEYWGKGYATEAITALIDYAFKHLKMETIVAEVDAANINSIKVLKKLNFIYQEKHNTEDTLQLYTLTKS
ncbi:GNAT family N-acetyltransferase [Lysinibacillus capsici]|uniref:GNAT family N-acetyltransferase n=1 Tax=Lysinibacillus TaxID=400634 RepID=UPI0027302724|nr:GNAT family N-acetyltransferase [Lysinibacillus capsici]MDP1392850.1 GNAT family N-acetyltransferase [Lysinibacillus capsici]MDP1413325.1 GNAT family N-acetyltransferase [Lysinibacillus capsici]MDP1429740.1 GNAT family N-acetyltransferase [Lysinibacillus capsici]WNN77488.1 GNAT family N-acetyltransferase [Lysinibacillus capsici]